MKTSDFLRQHDACHAGAKWALSISDDMSDVWNAMITQGKYDWLIWTATRPGVFPESILRKLACRFVRETPLVDGRTVWDLLTDDRSRKAVYVAEAYADGKATADELSAAFSAAWAAYDSAHAASAAYAAYAACAAADAADDSAYAASAAAHAASDAARAARAAAWAADDAAHAADAARTADAAYYAARAAKSAQVRMIAELGNPFKEELTHD